MVDRARAAARHLTGKACEVSSSMVSHSSIPHDYEEDYQGQRNLAYEIEQCFETAAEVDNAIIATAVKMLNQRFEGTRRYFIDGNGGIDFHSERRILADSLLQDIYTEDEVKAIKEELGVRTLTK